MNKKLKITALFTVILLVTAVGLSAQWGGPESNTSKATAGVFGNEIDDYMDVNYFGDVEIVKWMGFLGADVSDLTDESRLAFGYSQNIGGIRLGAAYKGNIVNYNVREDKTLDTTWSAFFRDKLSTALTNRHGGSWASFDTDGFTDGVPGTTFRNTDGTLNSAAFNSMYSNNNLALLLGFGPVGIKLGLDQDMITRSRPIAGNNTIYAASANGEMSTTNSYDEYNAAYGYMLPYIQAGFNVGIGERTLTPRIGFGYTMFSDNLRSVVDPSVTSLNGVPYGETRLNKRGIAADYDILGLDVGFDLDLTATMSMSLDYSLAMTMYDNDYSDSGLTGSVEGKANWNNANTHFINTLTGISRTTTTAAQVEIIELEETEHTIVPGFYYSKEPAETFKFGIGVSVPVSIASSKETPRSLTYNHIQIAYNETVDQHLDRTTVTNTTEYGSTTETTEWRIAPEVAVGASYAMFPGRFTINGGFRFSPFEYVSTQVKTTMPGTDDITVTTTTQNGATITETTATINDTRENSAYYESVWNGLVAKISAGFTFSFTENMALDFQADMLTPDANNFNMNLNQVNVLFSLKF